MMVFVSLADTTNSLESILVADMAAEGITRVRRVSDDTAIPNDVGRLPYEALLRIFRMEPEPLHRLMIAVLRPETL
jgi:hypothetical protein